MNFNQVVSRIRAIQLKMNQVNAEIEIQVCAPGNTQLLYHGFFPAGLLVK